MGSDAEAMVQAVRARGAPCLPLWRRLQPYLVSLYWRDFETARSRDLIEERMGLYLWRGACDSRCGIALEYPDPADLIIH